MLDRVRAVLETDRVWAAFALADLSPAHSGYCEWFVDAEARALLLVYRGFTPPLFFALGTTDDVAALLPEVAGEPELYISVREGVLERMTSAGYRAHDDKAMLRMVLRQGLTGAPAACRVERLEPGDHQELVRLFEDGDATGERPAFFQATSLEGGVYFGVREGGELIAAAGTLVCAPEECVACIGNVYTRRDRRGCGLASAVTAAVANELGSRGIQTIALNVRSDNHAAIRVYERLGFSRYCNYREARVTHCRTVTV